MNSSAFSLKYTFFKQYLIWNSYLNLKEKKIELNNRFFFKEKAMFVNYKNTFLKIEKYCEKRKSLVNKLQ